jgi:hypothetical protein
MASYRLLEKLLRLHIQWDFSNDPILFMQTSDLSKQQPWYVLTFPAISKWKNSVVLKVAIFLPGTLYIYIYIHIYTHTHTHIYTYIYTYTNIHTYIDLAFKAPTWCSFYLVIEHDSRIVCNVSLRRDTYTVLKFSLRQIYVMLTPCNSSFIVILLRTSNYFPKQR